MQKMTVGGVQGGESSSLQEKAAKWDISKKIQKITRGKERITGESNLIVWEIGKVTREGWKKPREEVQETMIP